LMQPPEGRIAILSAGLNLRGLRERLGLTMREVESASFRIAERHGNDEFAVGPSRLSDIETKGLVPSIYRLYSLSIVYRCDLREILAWYGVDLSLSAADDAAHFALYDPVKNVEGSTLVIRNRTALEALVAQK
jgi:transcriptional regulator with XRE-family HTH domain